MKLYNTLSRNIEELKPLEANTIKMYCCGPTVYNFAHIGNLRTYIFEDLLRRTIKKSGFELRHVMNITDVGHLTSDADTGEDKMQIAVEREKLNALDIARKYENAFFENSADLNIQKPETICRATEYIQEMIDFVKVLEDKGYAYFAGGNVYFDTAKFISYGALSGQSRDSLMHGARVEEDKNKRNPSDFVLWFTVSKFKNQVLQWPSPWGQGYPGWAIECSAMAMKNLGERVDIHCGGIDHIPVHHENEIAQSEAYLGHKWVEKWLHGEFLNVKDGKMGKSKGNFLTLYVLKENGYNPLAYRYLCLTSHYRQPMTFSFEALDGAANAYRNLKSIASDALNEADSESENAHISKKAAEYIDKINGFLESDLATAQALAEFWSALKDKSLSATDRLAIIADADVIFGLDLLKVEDEVLIPPEIVAIADERIVAKSSKNWAKADDLRKQIEKSGYVLKDLPNGKYEIKRFAN